MLAGFAGYLIMVWRTALEDALHPAHRRRSRTDPRRRCARCGTTIVSGSVLDHGQARGGKGNSAVEIRAVHDGKWVYFRFTWEDPTRSLKHLPLVKREDGWHVLHDRYDRADERGFFEDKFAALLTNLPIVIPGDHTYRGGPTPIADKPGPLSQRGLHLTSAPGLAMEVWQWKASSGGLLGWIDKNHFDLPADPTHAQTAGEVPYRGGYVQDLRAASLYGDNFEVQPVGGYDRAVQPKRLPTDWRATYAALGKVDLEPDQGDSEGARWWMTMAVRSCSSISMPGFGWRGRPGSLILAGDLAQQADIKGRPAGARKWTLEVARRLVPNIRMSRSAKYPHVGGGVRSRADLSRATSGGPPAAAAIVRPYGS